jgi:hypothetical protein
VELPLIRKVVNVRSHLIIAATALALLQADKAVTAQQSVVTLACRLANASTVYIEIVDDGRVIQIRDRASGTLDLYPVERNSLQMIKRIIEDRLRSDGYQCTENADRND